MLLQLLDMLTDASVCTFYVMPYVPCWILLCKMTFFLSIQHFAGTHFRRKQKIRIHYFCFSSALLLSSLLLNVAGE